MTCVLAAIQRLGHKLGGLNPRRIGAVAMQLDLARSQGTHLALRLVTEEDAEYIDTLRKNGLYNKYLSEVRGNVSDQRMWIKNYKNREKKGLEFYYVIERNDAIPCGLVRIYNIKNNEFTWGSWILEKNKPPKAALESAVLSFGIGFQILNCDRANIEVRADNEHAIQFYRRFGMVQSRRTESDIFFVYSRAKFNSEHQSFLDIVSKSPFEKSK